MSLLEPSALLVAHEFDTGAGLTLGFDTGAGLTRLAPQRLASTADFSPSPRQPLAKTPALLVSTVLKSLLGFAPGRLQMATCSAESRHFTDKQREPHTPGSDSATAPVLALVSMMLNARASSGLVVREFCLEHLLPAEIARCGFLVQRTFAYECWQVGSLAG